MTAFHPIPRSQTSRSGGKAPSRKPLMGVLCCNEYSDRPVQAVASRFVEPLVRLSGAAVLLVPALADTFDAHAIAERLDGLLLTGSRSNVAARRYGGVSQPESPADEQRDEVALVLAAEMIESGRPVYGICRGLQELNVLFGGTLGETASGTHFHPDRDDVGFEILFEHRHDIELIAGGRLAIEGDARRVTVNSVHQQGIKRLGGGLTVEAIATDDGLIEAFSAEPCGGEVLAVQWHPEWDTARCPTSRAFFSHIGASLRASASFA